MNRTVKPLRFIPHGQARVITDYDDNNRIEQRILRSYDTDVITLKYEYGTSESYCIMTVTGLYSMTTRKHISAFMREFTPFDYSTAKEAYIKNIRVEWII